MKAGSVKNLTIATVSLQFCVGLKGELKISRDGKKVALPPLAPALVYAILELAVEL